MSVEIPLWLAVIAVESPCLATTHKAVSYGMDGVDEAGSPRLGPTRMPEGRSRVCGMEEEDKRS